MYTVNFNGYPIHDPRLADVGIFSSDATASLMVNGAGSVSITLLPQHPNIDKIGNAGKLEVLADDLTIFRGRVRRKDEDFLRRVTFTAEGDLAALNDSVQPPYNFPADAAEDPELESSNVVEYLFQRMLERHNAQVEASQRILPGTVTVTDPNNYISRSMANPNYTWEAMSNAFWGSALGGYAIVRYEPDGTYLDYLAEITVKNYQRVEFGKNILDMTQYGDSTESCSAVYPVGAEGLTIKNIPDGEYRGFTKSGEILISPDAVSVYGGRIVKIQTWQDVTLAENLIDKAADWLATQGALSVSSVTCQAIDLIRVEGKTAPLMVGRATAILSLPHGINEDFILTETHINLTDPAATQVTFGKLRQSLSSEIVGSESSTSAAIDKIQTDIKGNAAYTKDEIARITTALQDSERILLAAMENKVSSTDFETYKKLQEAALEVLADRITITVSETDEKITDAINGIDSITTSTGYTFGALGLDISKAGEDIKNLIDNKGLSVMRGLEYLLLVNYMGVEALNLVARQYLVAGHFARFEDYTEGRTGCFWIGGESSVTTN